MVGFVSAAYIMATRQMNVRLVLAKSMDARVVIILHSTMRDPLVSVKTIRVELITGKLAHYQYSRLR